MGLFASQWSKTSSAPDLLLDVAGKEGRDVEDARLLYLYFSSPKLSAGPPVFDSDLELTTERESPAFKWTSCLMHVRLTSVVNTIPRVVISASPSYSHQISYPEIHTNWLTAIKSFSDVPEWSSPQRVVDGVVRGGTYGGMSRLVVDMHESSLDVGKHLDSVLQLLTNVMRFP
jgi:hypothetical protein